MVLLMALIDREINEHISNPRPFIPYITIMYDADGSRDSTLNYMRKGKALALQIACANSNADRLNVVQTYQQ